jgi:hypothetical protein
MNEGLNTETLIAAYHSTTRSWDKDRLIAGRRISTLLSGTARARTLELNSLQPVDVFRPPTHATSGLRFFPTTTLQCWESRVKGLVRLSEADDSTAEARLAFELDGFNIDVRDGIIHPLLNVVDGIPNLADHRSQVGNNPPGFTLTLLVSEDLLLNEKQRLVV